jgi:hypothetical protein
MATTKTMEGTVPVSEIRRQILTLYQESNCLRCGGLMVRDFCTDLLSGGKRARFLHFALCAMR